MIKFSEYIIEKVERKLGGGWTVLKLDDGTELMTNMELIDKGEIQISLPNKKVENIKINKNTPIIKQIEKVIGQKLDMKCKKTIAFIDLYPCECDV